MKLVSLSALNQAVTISRQQIAVIVICISLIPEVVLRIAVHHIPINHQAAVLQVVITINRQQEAMHHRTIAAQRKVLQEQVAQRKAIHMTLMTMAMMISIWMAIMTMTDMTETAIMPMVWMMQWMNLKNWGIRMKVLLYGYGLMGKKVAHQLREKDEFDLIGVVSYEFDEKAPEAMYSNLTEVQDRADVIIDFSHPNNLDDILAYAKKNKTKVVFATTGFSKEQLDKIEEASKEIAIFQSYNTSFGIQMVTKILRQVAKEFYDNGYDIEILEKHHNQKIDAPSGTAKLLYEVMEDEIQGTTPVYDRSSLHEKRKKEEIGIQALRGGTIFGEHEIMFAGLDEIIEIKHTALSKDVFVQGALAAAKALQDKEAGLFTLKTLY